MYELEVARTWHKIYASHLDLYISGIEMADYDPVKIADSSGCDLGQWLQQPRQEIMHLPHFQAVLAPHDRFHRIAAEMVQLHQSGEVDAAREILETRFKAASQDVLAAIDQLVEEYAHLHSGSFETSTDGAQIAPEVLFDDRQLMGVPFIDDQHKALAELVSRLGRSPDQSINSESVLDILTKFLDLILQHFETEEMYMRQCGMPQETIDEHLDQHSCIIEEIVDLEFEAMQGSSLTAKDLFSRLRNWVGDHLLAYDLEIRDEQPR